MLKEFIQIILERTLYLAQSQFQEINGAKLVCNHYGVLHYTIDFSDSFIEEVVENLVDEYISGRTPNPCVR